MDAPLISSTMNETTVATRIFGIVLNELTLLTVLTSLDVIILSGRAICLTACGRNSRR